MATDKSKEAMKLALEALEVATTPLARDRQEVLRAQVALREALAEPVQKYRRGNRLICLETEEYCVIHISGTDRQWVKFPDSHVGVYTNEQVTELFELLPKEPEQEPVALETVYETIIQWDEGGGKRSRRELARRIVALYTSPPAQRKPLTDEQIIASNYPDGEENGPTIAAPDFELICFARQIEAAHGIKENT